MCAFQLFSPAVLYYSIGRVRRKDASPKIAAPPVEQIKVWEFPEVSLCNFKAIGHAVSEKKIF